MPDDVGIFVEHIYKMFSLSTVLGEKTSDVGQS